MLTNNSTSSRPAGMFQKLLKYEWRATWKMPLIINIFMVIMTAVSIFTFYRTEWTDTIQINEIIALIMFFSIVVILIGGNFAVMVFLAVRFYKNLYTSEGYLMHTLPVIPRQLILSKTVVFVFWYYITTLAVLAASVLVSLTFISSVENDMNALFFSGSSSVILSEFARVFGMSTGGFVMLLLFQMLFSTIQAVLMIYGAISIGQTFQKHKILGSIGAYIGLYSILQMISSLLMLPYLIKTFEIAFHAANDNAMQLEALQLMRTTFPLLSIVSILFSLVMYFLTEHMMRKKLNLD